MPVLPSHLSSTSCKLWQLKMSLEIAKCPQKGQNHSHRTPGVNTLALTNFKLPTWHHRPWMWEKMCTVSQTRENHLQHTTVWEHTCTGSNVLALFLKMRYLGRISTWFKSYPFPTEMNLLAKLFFIQEVAWILPHKIMSHKAWLRLFWNRKYPKQMLTVTPRLIKNSH